MRGLVFSNVLLYTIDVKRVKLERTAVRRWQNKDFFAARFRFKLIAANSTREKICEKPAVLRSFNLGTRVAFRSICLRLVFSRQSDLQD